MRRQLHGHLLLEEEGPLDRRNAVRAHRAIALAGHEPRLVVTGGIVGSMAASLRKASGTPGVPRLLEEWPWRSQSNEDGFAVEYIAGVSFTSLLAQTREQDARLPPEAVAVLFADVTRAVVALSRAADRDLEPLSTAHIRVGFEGDTQIFPIPVAPADFDDIIGFIDYQGVARVVELGPSIGPGTVEEVTPAQNAAWHLGSLLFLSLGGRYPGANNPLEFLSVLERNPRQPSPADTPPALAGIYDDASTKVHTWDELEALAARLEAFGATAEGRRALGGCASGLFPELRRRQLAFLEEAPFFDVTIDLDVKREEPATVGRHVVPGLPRFAYDSHLVTHGAFAEFLRQTGWPKPSGFLDIPEIASQPVILVSHDDAQAFARWRGGRLATEAEWVALAWQIQARDVTKVWEWTSTPWLRGPTKRGFVVRGGPWRNRAGPGAIDHRSWEDGAAPDVGFRVVYDLDDPTL